MKSRQYKAFDFKTGNTYLIGEHESKAKARAYCLEHGMATIAQTLVALTEQEYQRAYAHRKQGGQNEDW